MPTSVDNGILSYYTELGGISLDDLELNCLHASTSFHVRVQLIEEHNTRCSSASFVEDVMDIGFQFTEPHREELRALEEFSQ